MEILKIIAAGIIEGFTGFLPVSSSGHMALLRNILGFGAPDSLLFDMILKIAAFIVIVIAMKKDVRGLWKAGIAVIKTVFGNLLVFLSNIGTEEKQPYFKLAATAYRKIFIMVLVALIPTAILGCLGRDFAMAAANTTIFSAICLIATGVMLFMTDGIAAGGTTPMTATYYSAFIIGAVQGISVLPGLSRCGMVAAVCLLFGYDKRLTFKFTFLSALPALIGAVGVDVMDMAAMGVDDAGQLPFYILAALLAVITGYIGLVITNKIIKHGKFLGLSIYCLVLGASALAAVIVM